MASKMPPTINGRNALTMLSAMQKGIRRGLERFAMRCAVELGLTSKNYLTMVCNRLELISHEDIGIRDPALIPLVKACCEQAREWHGSPGKWPMAIGSAIRAMSRSRVKSREGDHFQGVVVAEVGQHTAGDSGILPDWVYDMHTTRGQQKGRGVAHFRKSSAQLVPQPEPDQYEEEFYAVRLAAEGAKDPEKLF